ncbi:hypothetical protein CDAR_587331 [Caerostris darwini]|uniref:Uncharacterized protein n=1 Tax=Caerostris darwini TaxID=1538125 RepID=A0AAV4SJ01_9ARAC|nr:hypothetical protein CDAR_587311 [Caerostris darwini]GIY33775.1 hypothetical protein CDAR_587331 [Caerostris darwini]
MEHPRVNPPIGPSIQVSHLIKKWPTRHVSQKAKTEFLLSPPLCDKPVSSRGWRISEPTGRKSFSQSPVTYLMRCQDLKSAEYEDQRSRRTCRTSITHASPSLLTDNITHARVALD